MSQVSFSLKTLFIACMVASCGQTFALESISEKEMSEATGEGLAFFAENYSLIMGDTDYIKMTSRGGDDVPTGKKAEFYLYGLQIGGTDSANSYSRNVKPVNVGNAANPSRIRLYKSDFVPVADPNANTSTPNKGKKQIDVFEIAYPKRELITANLPKAGSEHNLKWSLWVDLLGRNGVEYQDTMVNGVPVNRGRAIIMADKMSWNGSYIQQWKTPKDPANPSYSEKVAMSGMLRANTAIDGYLRISADVRTDPSPITGTTIESNTSNARFGDAYVTTAPEFGADQATDNQEGLYWKNFSNNMPLGLLGYQPSIISSGGKSGRDLVIEVARIPNNPLAYNAAYIDYSKPADIAAKTCTATSCPTTATHATLSYQLHSRQKNGSYFDSDANGPLLQSNVPGRYFGLGLGANTANPGSAGISVDTNGNQTLQPLTVLGTGAKLGVATQGGTYSKFDGMFVQHLKLTTTAFD